VAIDRVREDGRPGDGWLRERAAARPTVSMMGPEERQEDMAEKDGADTVQGRLFEPRRPASEPRRPSSRPDRRRVLPSKEQRELGLARVRKLRERLAKLDDAA
jgi:hypothetical protein